MSVVSFTGLCPANLRQMACADRRVCDAGTRYAAQVRASLDTARFQSRPRKPQFRMSLPRFLRVEDGWNFCLQWFCIIITVLWNIYLFWGGVIRL